MSDQRLSRIEDKLDKVVESISRIDVTLAAQHVSLEEHIRRTNILEDEVKPIKDHVNVMKALVKVVGILSAILGLALTVKSLMGR